MFFKGISVDLEKHSAPEIGYNSYSFLNILVSFPVTKTETTQELCWCYPKQWALMSVCRKQSIVL